MSKQTAVDLFHDGIIDLLCNASVNSNTVAKLWMKCKVMEREQIEDAYCNGVIDGTGEILNRDTIKPDAVKYYQDNHGKEAKP